MRRMKVVAAILLLDVKDREVLASLGYNEFPSKPAGKTPLVCKALDIATTPRSLKNKQE